LIIILTSILSIIIISADTQTLVNAIMNPIMLLTLVDIENNNIDFDELAEIRERSDGPTLILMAVLFIIFIISMQIE